MKYFFILSFVFISTLQLTAQKGYTEGYAILANGDTVKGMIKHKSDDEVKEKITLKISEEEKFIYDAKEIKSFATGDEEFVAAEIPDEDGPVFLKKLAEGPITLYEYQYVIDQSGASMFKYEVYIKLDGSKDLINIKPGTFRKQISEYIADNPDLVAEVEKNKYKIDDIQKVVQSYNDFKLEVE